MAHSMQIGVIKRRRKLPIKDLDREEEIMKHILSLSSKFALDKLFIRRLFTEIISESKSHQSHPRGVPARHIRIVIIGIGLIGGSIALGLKKHLGSKVTILGLSSRPKKAQMPEKKDIIDRVLSSLADIPSDVNLIILAAPILTNLKLLRSLKKLTTSRQIIIDVGSTKNIICKEAEKLNLANFIGTHPMSGSESSGLENANPDLFEDKPWIICPSSMTDKNKIKLVKDFVILLGANPIIMNPETHDLTMAFASHIFLIISSILVNSVSKTNWNKISKVASTGFRDTTRLASHSHDMKKDIILTNRSNVKKALDDLSEEINIFSSLLESNNESELTEYFQKAKLIRDKWLEKHFFNL